MAEDAPRVRKLAERVLSQAGYTVLTAIDGEQAIAVFEARSDEIDLVLLDVVMPGVGGFDVHDRVVELEPEVRVLFSSGYSGREIGARTYPAGTIEMIAKPYRAESLLRRVRELLDRQ